MSTVKATNFSHPSAANPAIVLDAAGGATVAGMGLVLVSPTSIANSGGSASASGGAVSFTGVSSVSLNGVFTSAYDNYLVTAQCDGGGGAVRIRLRASGSDNSSSNYHFQRFYAQGTTVGAYQQTSQTSSDVISSISGVQSPFTVNIFKPFLSAATGLVSNGMYLSSATSPYYDAFATLHNVTSSFDGFSFYPVSGTFTGSVRVYGYKNS